MTYQEEEQARLRRQYSKQAIGLAIQGRWREAVAVNKDIIESFPNDADAYNRLGKAYMELGEYSQAKEAYEQALKFDSYNAIAKKNLRHLAYLIGSLTSSEVSFQKVEPRQFIEEIGKSGIVNLHRLAPPQVLAKMMAGDRVYLRVDEVNLVIENSNGEYLGQVEPKDALRLIKLMEGGNKYSAAIISSAEDKMTVIIKEEYQDPSQVGHPSFPSRRLEELHPYVSDRLLRREIEHEGKELDEPGYTIIDDEAEPSIEEITDINNEVDEEGV